MEARELSGDALARDLVRGSSEMIREARGSLHETSGFVQIRFTGRRGYHKNDFVYKVKIPPEMPLDDGCANALYHKKSNAKLLT